MASTSVVLPWSTCATIATLRRSGRRARAMRDSLREWESCHRPPLFDESDNSIERDRHLHLTGRAWALPVTRECRPAEPGGIHQRYGGSSAAGSGPARGEKRGPRLAAPALLLGIRHRHRG